MSRTGELHEVTEDTWLGRSGSMARMLELPAGQLSSALKL